MSEADLRASEDLTTGYKALVRDARTSADAKWPEGDYVLDTSRSLIIRLADEVERFGRMIERVRGMNDSIGNLDPWIDPKQPHVTIFHNLAKIVGEAGDPL